MKDAESILDSQSILEESINLRAWCIVT